MRKPFVLLLVCAVLLTAAMAGVVFVHGSDRPFVALSAAEQKWLDENRHSIVLTYDAIFPPLEYQDTNGNYAGMGADIIARVETRLGVTFDKRPSHDWNSLLASLETGATHLNGGMVRTAERERMAFFTAPYITLPLAIITTKRGFTDATTWQDLKGRRVAVVSGYASETFVRDNGRDLFEVVLVNSVQEGLRKVSFGVVDAFVDNLATSSYQIERDSLTNLRVAGVVDFTFPMSISVSRKYPLLFSAVQKALSDIPSEDMEAARKRWISLAGEGLLSVDHVRQFKLAGVFLALLLLGLGGITYVLKRRLNEQVAILRQAQEELLDQTERLGLATEATNSGVWDFYPATGKAYFSDQWYSMLGLEPGAVEATFAGWLQLMHPEERLNTANALMGYIEAGGEGVFEAEYRMRQADGAWRWVLGKGRAIAWDKEGNPTRLVGLNMDIQKLKGVQEALLSKSALLEAQTNASLDGILVVNENFERILLNQKMLDLFNFPSHLLNVIEDVVLLDYVVSLTKNPVQFRARVDYLYSHPDETSREEIEFTNGMVLDRYSAPVLSIDGKYYGRIWTFRDITERKQAEEALRNSEEKYRAIFTNAPIGIFRSSFGGSLLEANPALARMHGYDTVQEFVGSVRNAGKVLYADPGDRQRLLNALLETPSGVSLSGEFLRKDRSSFLGIINAALHMDEHGMPSVIDGSIEDVTERKLLELRIADQLSLQQSLLDTIPYAMFYKGSDTRFVGCNKAYEDWFGVRRQDFIGRRVLDLEYLPAEDRQAYQAEDEAVISSVGKVHREVSFLFADGQLHQTLYSVTGFRLTDGTPGGLIGIIVDITELKQAEERLRQSEEKFSRIFEMAPECISFVRLRDMAIMDVNTTFETVTGYTRGEILSRTAPELGIWNDLAVRKEFLKRLETDGHVMDLEFMLRRKDGSLRRVVNSAQLVSLAGEQCYISVIHDITDERKMQDLLIQSEKMVSVGGLAAGIAHEINNPLGIVHQAVQNIILRTKPDQKKNMETAASLGLDMNVLQQYLRARKLDVFLEDIQAAAVRASSIIRNMLDFSRRSESKRQVCDMHRIIKQSVFLASSDYDLKKAFDFRRIEVVLEMEEVLPLCSCTETEIEQVILNLLRNSAQAMAMATPPTANPRIVIRLRAGESCVRIEVEDNGPGMDADTQRKALEPFFTTKPPGVGTGLGLSVSYFIITKGHGGKMWLSSALGKGSTFFVELPADEQEAEHD